MAENDLGHELDAILDSYTSGQTGSSPDEEQERQFLARFERIKVEIIKPTMEAVGEYLEKKGHAYQITDDASIRLDNPSIKMEIYPKTPPGEPVQDHEFPVIAFIAEPDVAAVGIEVRDGMPGRPGLTRGHTTDLDSLTKEYVRNQIVVMVKMNFEKRPRKR